MSEDLVKTHSRNPEGRWRKRRPPKGPINPRAKSVGRGKHFGYNASLHGWAARKRRKRVLQSWTRRMMQEWTVLPWWKKLQRRISHAFQRLGARWARSRERRRRKRMRDKMRKLTLEERKELIAKTYGEADDES